MTELTKIQPMNDSLKQTLLLLSEKKLNLPLFEKIVNFPKIVNEKKNF